jgi:hypothetical protein
LRGAVVGVFFQEVAEDRTRFRPVVLEEKRLLFFDRSARSRRVRSGGVKGQMAQKIERVGFGPVA